MSTNQLETINTIFGNAKLNTEGYYVIKSGKEGNNNKYLHRLIYERFWGVELLKEVYIHHKDGNKLNNCILNLEALLASEHNILHKKGVNRSLGTIKKISNAKNTTGYFRVCKHKRNDCKQGFDWVYRYCDGEGKRKQIVSVDIDKLEKKVKDKGLPWIKFEEGE